MKKVAGSVGKRPRNKIKPVRAPVVKRRIWVRPDAPGPIHPEIDRQLSKPFLSSIYIDEDRGCFRYPVNGQPDAIVEGIHKRMLRRFFRNIPLPKMRITIAGKTKRLASSMEEGSRADTVLEECVRTQQPPPPPGHRGCSPYATAVWNYWMENHHRPVVAQLPVVFSRFNVATAGDYITIRTDPQTGWQSVWLWELKTGWPATPKNPEIMAPPLAHVPMTAVNRWQLQLMLTRMGYEKELGMSFSGGAHVLHVWKEREGDHEGAGEGEYTCRVHVVLPEELNPPNWPLLIDRDTLYESMAAKSYKK